jgi:hypothetical protein
MVAANSMASDGGNGGQLCVQRRISRDDVLQYLSADGSTPSALGGQLERLEAGIVGEAQAIDVSREFDRRMLALVGVIRCVDALERYASIRFVGCVSLRRFAGLASLGDGRACIGVMRAYQTWATKSQERGLAQVHLWMRSRVPTIVEPDTDGDSLVQAFRARKGTASKARAMALRVLADSELVIAAWIEIWNRKDARWIR